MQPQSSTGRGIVYATQYDASWSVAVKGYQRAVEESQFRLKEMKKPNSRWGYHHVTHIIREFPEGKFEEGYRNPFLGCSNETSLELEETVMTSQLAEEHLAGFVQCLRNSQVVKGQSEQDAVLKFLRKKAKNKTHGAILEFYPESLVKCFNKIKFGIFKSEENKAGYKILKDDMERKLEGEKVAGAAVIETFLKQLQSIDVARLKEELVWAKPKMGHAAELLSLVEDVIQWNNRVIERKAIVQLIMDSRNDPEMVDCLNDLRNRGVFDQCLEVKKFFGLFGQLLADASPSFNRSHAIYVEYSQRKEKLDLAAGCTSLQMKLQPRITLEICNAFLLLGDKKLILALPGV